MSKLAALFSRKSDLWATPPLLFEDLRREFGFNLDPCCEVSTAKCQRFFTPERGEDGLAEDWGRSRVFMNPPYSQAAAWMQKAAESARAGAVVVALIPARTDTHWWHEWVMPYASEVRLLRGRVRYWLRGQPGGSSTFPSSVIVYQRGAQNGGRPLLDVGKHPKKWEELRRLSLVKFD